MPRPVPDYIASFDSASAMVRALGRFLRGEDFPRRSSPIKWAGWTGRISAARQIMSSPGLEALMG